MNKYFFPLTAPAIFFFNDFLYSFFNIQTVYFIPLGILLFVFIQVIAVKIKRSSNHRITGKPSVALKSINSFPQQFVPGKIRLFLKKESITEMSPEEHIQNYTTICFCDFRNMPAIPENRESMETFDFNNIFMGKIEQLIRKHRGFIEKHDGDGVMAIFPDNADEAIEAAIALHRELNELNETRHAKGGKIIDMGIGIHTVAISTGIVGEDKSGNSPILSDAISICSGIDDAAKDFGITIGVSEQTFAQLKNPNEYNYRFSGRIILKGKNEPISIFDFIDGDPEEVKEMKISSKSSFEDSVLHFYNNRIDQALAGFHTSLKIFPGDKASIKYMEKSGRKLY